MNIIVPDKNNLNKINKKFDNLFSKMLNNKTQIQTLSNLRDSLLPRLMNGKVKV
jgi:type I restriction enzyme, S subunit